MCTRKSSWISKACILHIIKFTVLCFSIHNLYIMSFSAKISLLSNSVAMKCCQRILVNVPFTAILLTNDKAHFHLTGCVNKQNFRYWAGANPHELHERLLHNERVTVWYAEGEFVVLGPYFFEDEHGSAVTITSARFIEMLENFQQPQLNELAADVEDIWFQQDGATVHTTQGKMHIIFHCSDIPWPARSPDLALCDFTL